MTEQSLLQLIQDSIQITIIISGPVLLIGLVVGVTISILQVVTSVQDATLSFVPRIVTMLLVTFLLLAWMTEKMTSFTINLFSHFAALTG